MTNAQIIFNESVTLMKQGILESVGQATLKMLDAEGKEFEQVVDIPEEIHTYANWKSLGYQVKKGEKAIASFTIWKYATKKAEPEDDEEPESVMFLKKASFFKSSQVEAI